MKGQFTESVVEDAALAWLESLGYTIKHLPAPQNDMTRQAGGPEIGPDITPGGDTLTLTSQRERETYSRQLVQKMQQLL